MGLADYVKPSCCRSLLGRFNRLYPGVTMEMRTGLSMDLLPGYERGELDVVIAGRGMVFKDGGLLYRDSLVWVAAPGFQLRLDRPVPLRNPAAALHPPRHQPGGTGPAGIPWRFVYVSSSTAGLQAAVQGGLGIAMVPKSAMIPELRILGAEQGLPPLPDFEIEIFVREKMPPPSCRAFVDFMSEELACCGHQMAGSSSGLTGERRCFRSSRRPSRRRRRRRSRPGRR